MLNRKEARKRLTVLSAALLLSGTIFTGVCTPVVAESEGELKISQDTPVTEAPETDVPGSGAPETDAPDPEEPETDAPDPEEPETDTPDPEEPETDTPDPEEPGTGTPDPEEPGTGTPDPEEPVDRSINTSAPVASIILTFSSSCSTFERCIDVPILAFILTVIPSPTAVGITSSRLLFFNIAMRPCATFSRTNSGVTPSFLAIYAICSVMLPFRASKICVVIFLSLFTRPCI